jgi:phosphoglucomutase
MYMDDYKRWLEADLEDPALTAELQSIAGQDQEI